MLDLLRIVVDSGAAGRRGGSEDWHTRSVLIKQSIIQTAPNSLDVLAMCAEID